MAPMTASSVSASAFTLMGERLAQGVERARADVAVDDADRTDDEADERRPWRARLRVAHELASHRRRRRDRRRIAASWDVSFDRSRRAFHRPARKRALARGEHGGDQGFPLLRRGSADDGAAIYAVLRAKRSRCCGAILARQAFNGPRRVSRRADSGQVAGRPAGHRASFS